MRRFHFLLLFVLTACASGPAVQGDAPGNAFFSRLSGLCGQAFAGRIVSPPVEADRDFADKRLLMYVRDCSESEIRIPFQVGDDRSRTWVIRRQPRLALSHDHRHADGSEDELSRYGGVALRSGTADRQEFPADHFSRELFRRKDLLVSVDNVWAMEVHPGRVFVYELRRPSRFFRVEFDLTRPMPMPADEAG